ncbi:MAG: AraC family transcriptional regulator [Ruminococcaceae bacterium]|nr:AraC family transcriptional regulator [Oscillospiraceae bacterium]
MSSLIQKSEILIGNTKIEIVMQAGFAEHGYDKSVNPNLHCHPNFEAHYIEEGACIFYSEENKTNLEKDTIILVPAKVYHAFERSDDNSKKISFEIRLVKKKSGSDLFSEYEELLSSVDKPFIINGFSPEFSALSACRGIIIGEEAMCKINANFTIVFLKICDILRSNAQLSEKKISERTAEINASDEDMTLIQILNYISRNAKRQLRIAEVAGAVNLSPRQLQRILSQRMKEGFHSILTQNRIAYAKAMISDKSCTLSLESIAFECGFTNYVSFWEQFKKITGESPEKYRRKI